MNEFDCRLETQLRGYLDPLVGAPVPVRRVPKYLTRTRQVQGLIELPALSLVAVRVEVLS
jgi:hypothetical protein